MGRYRGVLFDLFGTLVRFDPSRLPELDTGTERVRSTAGGLTPLLAEWVPGVTAAEFWRAVLSVSEEMARARANDLVELPSRERFRRALERVGCDDDRQMEAALHLSRAHMALIAEATVLPAAHADLFASVRAGHRVGLVSNFDDTSAAYEILVRHGVAHAFDTVIVSEALGLRKPHPAVVRAALRGLGLDAADVLLVGDTFAEDVLGAQAAGVDAVWIDVHGVGAPPSQPPPRHVIRALPELAGLL
jgi:HAD superfamily hydrolase (TIGR01509 family)